MVEPRESSHFEFYEEGQGKIKVPLRESALYTEDRLGLKVSMISKREYYAPLIIHKSMSNNVKKLYDTLLCFQALDEEGKLDLLDCPGDHLQFTDAWFTENIIHPYFM